MAKKTILGRQYPTKKERSKLGIVVRRELRIAIGDQKTFNRQQRNIEKRGRIKEKKLKKGVKKLIKGGLK